MAATDREQQILAWIKQNPLISQNELAELCGITRSGVAAHISNLMKKGYIQGKGYIVTPPSYVAVVGAINIDHYGVAMQDVVGESSNRGWHWLQYRLQSEPAWRAELFDFRLW